jgi:SAM-dependent methyltransferase
LNASVPGTPRWGNVARDRKATAIATTMSHHCGETIFRGRWLDVGCGSGGIAAGLSEYVDIVVGVDPEPWDAWHEATNGRANLTFTVATFDSAELPIEPASCDVVVCNQVYEHVLDPRQLLRNIHDALRPGGRCYFAGPNLLWPIEPHVFWPFVHWLPRRMALRLMRLLGSKQAGQLDAYSTHYWQLKQWFQDAGLVSRPAIAARLVGELAARGWHISLPRWAAILIDGLVPLSPGFVCILRKS